MALFTNKKNRHERYEENFLEIQKQINILLDAGEVYNQRIIALKEYMKKIAEEIKNIKKEVRLLK